MATPAPKKRTCTICGTEHNVGESCPTCNWDQEKEEALAKADRVRREMREKPSEGKEKNKSWFSY